MLDHYQFTLLIVAVGLGALLVSFNTAHQAQIEDLTAQLATLDPEPLGDKEEGNPGTGKAITQRKAELSERLESFTFRQHNSMISVLLLLSFMILLAVRILLWSWQNQHDSPQSRAPVRLLWLDRTLMSVLAVLLLHVCISHLVLDVPHMLANN